MKKLMSMVIVLFFVWINIGAAMELPVIGKAAIKKGTELPIVVMTGPTDVIVGDVTAFEDQVVYLTAAVLPVEGEHRGGYTADGEGFVHDCKIHGREVMGISILIISIEQVESGEITIELF